MKNHKGHTPLHLRSHSTKSLLKEPDIEQQKRINGDGEEERHGCKEEKAIQSEVNHLGKAEPSMEGLSSINKTGIILHLPLEIQLHVLLSFPSHFVLFLPWHCSIDPLYERTPDFLLSAYPRPVDARSSLSQLARNRQ